MYAGVGAGAGAGGLLVPPLRKRWLPSSPLSHALSLLALSAVAAAATAGETSGQQIFMPGSSRSPRVETVGPSVLARPFPILVEPGSHLTVVRYVSRAQGDAASAAGPTIGAIGGAITTS